MQTYLQAFDRAEPDAQLQLPLQALWWLRKGSLKVGAEWERAHDICQSAEGNRPLDWVHALAHLIEGDIGNANYWYRRAGEQRTGSDHEEEWDHIVEKLGQEFSTARESAS